MRIDHDARGHWVEFFKKHLLTIINLGIDCVKARNGDLVDAQQRAEQLKQEFYAVFDAFHANPNRPHQVTILTLDEWRDGLLRKHGFVDPFIDLKNNENEGSIQLLKTVCQQIDALSGIEQVRAVIEGVFAGNIFDMGAAGSAQLLLEGKLDFFSTRSKLPKRPWLVDSYDAAADALLTKKYKKLVFFIDNAGSDFLLGAIPMMRWFAMRGTQVIMACNERPTLNDMTIHDVKRWWPRVIEQVPSIASLPITPISTGTGEPLIDLLAVSDELNEAASDADIVIVEGMGRGVESNLDAEFSCDAMNLAMIKDIQVAKRLNGKLYDVVCKFR